jgi:hypothetical protein
VLPNVWNARLAQPAAAQSSLVALLLLDCAKPISSASDRAHLGFQDLSRDSGRWL